MNAAPKVSQRPQLNASWIDRRALEIVQKLQLSKHTTYLVGGCVRDLLLGVLPKDFDIATSARPEEVRRKIPGSYLIGRRFRLILVKRGADQFEVATFRRTALPEELDSEVAHQENNLFGSPEQDALRRDFTINALFYDPVADQVIDFTEGLRDLKAGLIRMIGDPRQRIEEDPIRSLRAIRLAHKTGLVVEPSFRMAISDLVDLPAQTPLPRRRLEYLKLFSLADPSRAFLELWDLGLLRSLMPSLHEKFESEAFREHLFLSLAAWQGSGESMQEQLLPWIWSWLEVFPDDPAGIDRWMLNELGVFKAEQSEIWGSLDLIPRLQNFTSFAKKGPRRQKSFLLSPQLPVALRLAQRQCLLSPAANGFWESRIFSLQKT